MEHSSNFPGFVAPVPTCLKEVACIKFRISVFTEITEVNEVEHKCVAFVEEDSQMITFCLICVDGCNHLVNLLVVILEGSPKGDLDQVAINLIYIHY